MNTKKVFGIQIFQYEKCSIVATSKDGRAKATFTAVKWSLPEMRKYDSLLVSFDGEDISIYKNNAVIYTVNLCRIPSYFEKLERAFHPMEWEEF